MTAAIKTVLQATLLLKPPLRLGDEKQLAAVKFIELVEECAAAIRVCQSLGHDPEVKCWKCHGSGSCSHCEAECEECDGSGEQDGCTKCLAKFPWEVRKEALARADA